MYISEEQMGVATMGTTAMGIRWKVLFSLLEQKLRAVDPAEEQAAKVLLTRRLGLDVRDGAATT